MWKIITNDGTRFVCGHYIGGFEAIHLWKYNLYYCCHVYSSNHRKRFNCFLKDESLELLKFKSLLKAKEVGWNVSISNLRALDNNERYLDT